MRLKNHLLRIFLLPLAMLTTSCGGGTSGTSSPTPLMLTGYAEQADGSRGAGLTMSVRASSSSNIILTSGTDQNGDFSMELPVSERSFVIEVDGVGSTQISRRQSGDGNIATKLTVTPNDELITKDLFEAQLAADEPCRAIEVYNNQVLIVAPLTEANCKVKIITTSSELNPSSFIGTLSGSCPNQTETKVAAINANRNGVLLFDLAPALMNECSDLNLVVTHASSPGLESRFEVLAD